MQRSFSWPSLIAMGLTFTAFAMDQTLWIWSGQLQAVCFNDRNPNGTASSNLVFAAPFLMLLLGQMLLWRLPRSGARDKFYWVLAALLLAYIPFSALQWIENGYFSATAEELSSCLNDVLESFSFVPAIDHMLMWLPGGIFLVIALISFSRHRLNRVMEKTPTDSPR